MSRSVNSAGKAGRMLRRCPMCGGTAEVMFGFVRDEEGRAEPRYDVRCTSCGVRTQERDEAASAVASWNRRTVRTAPRLKECPFCGGSASYEELQGGTVGVTCVNCGQHVSGTSAAPADAAALWNRRGGRE